MKYLTNIILFVSCLNLYAEEPWEKEDLLISNMVEPNIFLDYGVKMVELYQNKIATNSVSRCPYYTSCSYYTIHAIRQYGLLPGILFFIDRNLYRENQDVYKKYLFKTDKNDAMKINDDFFIGKQ